MTKFHNIQISVLPNGNLQQPDENLKGTFIGYSLSTSRVPGKRMMCYSSIQEARDTAVSIDGCNEEINPKQEIDEAKKQYKIEEMHVLYVKKGGFVVSYLQDNENYKNLTRFTF